MSARVTAVRLREGGALVLEDHHVPAPGRFELAVRVRAAALNRADVLQRRGFYPAPAGAPPDVPGLEYAGEVADAGEGVTAFRPGDRVMGIVGGGALAERVVVHEREAIAVPAGMDLAQAAAVPEVFLTAFDAFRQAELQPGEVVLVHAAGSGVGTAAIQLAHAAGARVAGTSRTQAKLDRCRDELGLEVGLVVPDGRFDAMLRELHPGGADVILDGVGGPYLAEDLRALALRGRIVAIGTLGGRSAELSLSLLLARRARLIGTVLRNRPLEEKATLAQAFTRQVLPLLAAKRVRPVVDDVLPMSRAAEALERLERNESFGKLVLTW